MKTATCYLKSVSPYSQNKRVNEPKKSGENQDDYEKRTWKYRMHVSKDGHVQIPPMTFANSMKEAAKYMAIQIPGKGKSLYTKHFESGVMVSEPLILEQLAEDTEGEWVYVPTDGIRGGSKRVDKCFPVVERWSGWVTYYILDDIITEEVFLKVLRTSGSLIGIGRFRPRNWGYYGRFKVVDCKWEEGVEI